MREQGSRRIKTPLRWVFFECHVRRIRLPIYVSVIRKHIQDVVHHRDVYASFPRENRRLFYVQDVVDAAPERAFVGSSYDVVAP